MIPEVTAAIEEIKNTFPSANIDAKEDPEGGAVIFVDSLETGEQYLQRETWLGFRITFQYPYADVYPLFVRADLARIDGQPLGEGTSLTQFEGRDALQLSRASRRLNAEIDTAALKVLKVMAWLRSK